MSKTKHKRYSDEFKAKVALESIKGEQTMSESFYGKAEKVFVLPMTPSSRLCLLRWGVSGVPAFFYLCR